MTDELIPAAFGAMFFAFGYLQYTKTKRLKVSGIKVEGEVVGVYRKEDTDGKMEYPIVRYLTVDKQPITEKYNFAVSSSDSFKEGQKVNVVYDPDDVRTYMIDNKTARNTGPLFMIIGASIFLGEFIYSILKK